MEGETPLWNSYSAAKSAFAASGFGAGVGGFAPGANPPRPKNVKVLLKFQPSGRSSWMAMYLSLDRLDV